MVDKFFFRPYAITHARVDRYLKAELFQNEAIPMRACNGTQRNFFG